MKLALKAKPHALAGKSDYIVLSEGRDVRQFLSICCHQPPESCLSARWPSAARALRTFVDWITSELAQTDNKLV